MVAFTTTIITYISFSFLVINLIYNKKIILKNEYIKKLKNDKNKNKNKYKIHRICISHILV